MVVAAVAEGAQAQLLAAKRALTRWQEAPGQLVGAEAHTARLWSASFNRVIESVDGPTRFGFIYATNAVHVDEGQECFVIVFDTESGSVHYLIEAVSRPKHILARIGYPFLRAVQRRFARDSYARMKSFVLHG